LGVNATMDDYSVSVWFHLFQWAPTLGGECYPTNSSSSPSTMRSNKPFQWAPTLGGECYYTSRRLVLSSRQSDVSMGTHPWG